MLEFQVNRKLSVIALFFCKFQQVVDSIVCKSTYIRTHARAHTKPVLSLSSKFQSTVPSRRKFNQAKIEDIESVIRESFVE